MCSLPIWGETLADPLAPGFCFDLIRLSVPMVEPLVPSQLQLEGGSLNEEAMANLVDRLSTRLGRGRLRRLVPRDSHIPEQAAHALPAVEAPAPSPSGWSFPRPGDPPIRPLPTHDKRHG